MRTYLKPVYSNVKSFGNKAEIEISNDKITLYSYLTEVATIEKNKATVFNTQSNTTVRHIKEFLLQNGFKAENKKQIELDYFI